MMFSVVLEGILIAPAIANAVPPEFAAVYQFMVTLTVDVFDILATFSVLILYKCPEPDALLNNVVVPVVVTFVPVVLPVIVVNDIKFGAVILSSEH